MAKATTDDICRQCEMSVLTAEASGDEALTCSIRLQAGETWYGRLLSLEDMVPKSTSNQVNPFSFSTSFRSREKDDSMLEINAAKSYIICLLCKYCGPHLEKVV